MGRLRVGTMAALTAGLVAAAGCGGGGGDERLSKEEFVTAADAICKDANAQIDALGEPASFDDLSEMTAKVRSISEDHLTELMALSPPADIEVRVNEAFGLIEQQIGLMDDLVAAAEAKDAAKLEEIANEGSTLDDRSNAIAKEIGLVECGDG